MKKIFIVILPIVLYTKEVPLIECSSNAIDINELKSERLISPDGQGSEFYFKVDNRVTRVFISEKPRVSQISKDLIKLVRLGATIVSGRKSFDRLTDMNGTTKECFLYKQSFKRAFVQIITVDNQSNQTLYVFNVGEIEHLYLTADMPITNIKELSYDKDSQTIYESKQPSSFYLGINYKIGDVYTYYPIDKFYNNLSLKAMIKVSDKPSESMGLGFGYHLTDGIEIFVAKVWTQYANVKTKGSGYTPTTTYGLSFDLKKALEWVQNYI